MEKKPLTKHPETRGGINEKTFRDRGSRFDYYPINCRRTCTRLVPREIKNYSSIK